MALLFKKTLMSGVTMTYHRVLSASINYETNRVEAIVGSYIDEEARRAGRIPVETRQVGVNLQGQDVITDPRVWLYGKAMAAMLPAIPATEATDTAPGLPGMPPMPSNEISAQFPGAEAA